jgi:membrane protein required for colicin V production
MNFLDIIIAALLVFAFVRGIMKGLFAEIAALVAIVAGVYFAINYSYYAVAMLEDSVLKWSHQTYKIVGFSATFLAVVLLIIFIGKVLTKIADITALGMVNKLLGGIFGALKTALILSVIFILFDKLNNNVTFIKQKTLDESMLYDPVRNIAPLLFPSIIKEDKDGKQVLEFPEKFK